MSDTKLPAAVSAGDGVTNGQAAAPPARVLLVDDQPARLLTYESILSGLGVDCVWASSGTDALGRLLKDDFAVLLLDVNMPGMDGFEVARLVREHPRLERTPIIFVTAINVSELDRLRGYEVGAIDYISVPIVPEILRSKVAVLVELHRRRSELQQLNHALAEARAERDAEHAKALAYKEAQLRAVFEHPTAVSVVLRAQRNADDEVDDWIYQEANASTLALLGTTREALIGRRLRDVFPPERARLISDRCTRVLLTGEPTHYESRFGGRDFLATIYSIGDDCVVSSGVDVTERVRTEAALRDSERRYRALVEDAPVAVAHNTVEGRFEWANQAFCDLVGYTLQELRARTWQDITHPDDLQAGLALSGRVLAQEQPNYTLEKRYIRKDGAIVWAQLFGNMVHDDRGVPVQAVAIVIDINARKQADAALRASEERFRDLANNIDQFAWTCDELGRATWYNDRWYQYTGTTFDQARGDGWQRLHSPAHLSRVMAGVERCIADGEPWEDTFPIRGKDGQYRWFLSRAIPIRDENGSVLRWFGTSTDVTAQRELQEALQDSDRRKDEFLAMLAHELRNPVAPIGNVAEVLSRVLAGDEDKRSLADIIRRQAMHLSRLLDDLLDVARVTQGHIELRRTVTPVATCVHQAIETAQPLIREREHRLAVIETHEALHVNVDRVRLAQAVANIIINAAKYTHPGGEIRITTFADAGQAVIEICDSGIGIAPQFLPKVFDLFAQSDRSLDRSQGGLGIGLAVCKKLVEMHGGIVTADSNGPGLGATFTIRLPIAEALPDATAQSQAPSAPVRRVLVVDDNQDSADSMAMLLELEGHDVRAVYSALDALQQVSVFAPEIVLLDIGLPGMNGYDIAQRIATMPSPPRLVAVSGYAQREDKERSAAAGFSAHLVKPVDVAELRKVLLA
jgi:PAS domain S-box-containing protein